jgi:hypothetical protein
LPKQKTELKEGHREEEEVQEVVEEAIVSEVVKICTEQLILKKFFVILWSN